MRERRRKLRSGKLSESWISLIKNVKLDDATLKLKSYEAMVDVSKSESTKIIIPSELQNLVTAATVVKKV